MGLAIKFALLLGASRLVALLLFCILFFLRPLATTFWFRRIALYRAGLRKTKLSTSVGQQTRVARWRSGLLLVLLHGAGDQAATWYRVAPGTEAPLSTAGSGPRRAWWQRTSGRHAEPGNVVDRLGSKCSIPPPGEIRNFVIAGNSLGAWMAMLLAQKHPHRVTRAILIDGGPIKNPSELGLMPKNREEARKSVRCRPRSILARGRRTLSSTIWSAFQTPAQFPAAGRWRREFRSIFSRANSAASKSRWISSGVLPIAWCHWAMRRSSNLCFLNCTLSVIERCGHAPQLERPHEFTRVLLRLVQSDSDAPVHSWCQAIGGSPVITGDILGERAQS